MSVGDTCKDTRNRIVSLEKALQDADGRIEELEKQLAERTEAAAKFARTCENQKRLLSRLQDEK